MVRNTKRRVVVNLEGEEWTLEYDSAANYLTMVGEGQNFGLQPGEIDLADDQREQFTRGQAQSSDDVCTVRGYELRRGWCDPGFIGRPTHSTSAGPATGRTL
jgi:hypothetical protein